MEPADRLLLRDGLMEWVEEDFIPELRLAAREAIEGLVEELAPQKQEGAQKGAAKVFKFAQPRAKHAQPRAKHEVRKKPKPPLIPPAFHVIMKHKIVRMLKAKLLAQLKKRWETQLPLSL